jgi:hypothetical protein
MADNKYSIQFSLKGAKEGAQDIEAVKEAVKELNTALKGVGLSGIDDALKKGKDQLVKGLASDVGLEMKKTISKAVHEGLKSGTKSFGSDNALLAKTIPDSAIKQSQREFKNNVKHLESELTKAFKGMSYASPHTQTSGFFAQFSNNWGGRGVSKILGGAGVGPNAAANIGGFFSILGTLRLAFWEIQPVLNAFKSALSVATDAIKRGSDLYVKAAQLRVNSSDLYRVRKASAATGLPESEADKILLMMRTGRAGGRDSNKNMGDFMQVSALKDVFKEVFDQTERAGEVMERTAGSFFNVQLAAQQLNTEFEVTGSLLAEYISGAVKNFIDDMKGLLETLNVGDIITGLSKELGVALMGLQKVIGLFSIAVQGFFTGIQLIADAITWLMVKLNNLAAKVPGAGKLGITPIDTPNSKIFEGSLKMVDALRANADKWWKNWDLKASNRKAPNAPLMNYSLPHMGMWEKLGLSFGSGGVMDYQKQTAYNTKRMADAMSQFMQRHAPPTGLRPRNQLNHA